MSSYQINRQWTEFGGPQLMEAARRSLRRFARRPVDDQDACDCIAIAFGRYRKHFSDAAPVDSGLMIRVFLQSAARNVLNLKRDVPIGDAQGLADVEEPFNPDQLLEAIARLPLHLRETAYAVATLGCASDAAESLGVSRSCVSKRLAAMRDHDAMRHLEYWRRVACGSNDITKGRR
jgi:DNA-directed RNA polymerase specialized sigma24 family protein